MLRALRASIIMLFSLVASNAQAQGIRECKFGFDIDTQSSAFQAMVVDGEVKSGFWFSISRAPREVRALGRFIGRLQVCLMTPDGKPRTIVRSGKTIELKSPFVSNCTAALLPGNRLLTNAHCYSDPALADAGFTIVHEARVNFGYTSKDDTGSVSTFRVATVELAIDKPLDAMVLGVTGGDANELLGGHIPMKMTSSVEPFQSLTMVHHPGAAPQQYSTGSCQVHRRQSEIATERSPLRHTCESMGGSSGSLLLDARTLAVVALHNQGGLKPSGDSFNSGHKIANIGKALDLMFEDIDNASTCSFAKDDFIKAAEIGTADALLRHAEAYEECEFSESARRIASRNSIDGEISDLDALVDLISVPIAEPNQSTSKELISKYQSALNSLGFDAGVADGLLGPQTQTAIERFQLSNGLATTAAPDLDTTSALQKAMLNDLPDAKNAEDAQPLAQDDVLPIFGDPITNPAEVEIVQ